MNYSFKYTHLACSFISAHLQADCGLVKRLVCLSLWVIQMSPGAISGHPSLTSAFICPHLSIEKTKDVYQYTKHERGNLTED